MNSLEALVIPLLGWYNENARVLPWRTEATAYHVWLSEVMLQQTRVAAVLDYYRRFLERFPTIEDLASADEDTLMKQWQGLGYYSRARNLQKAAKVIVERYGGVFPADYAAIRALPGIGDYTAGAVASIAFGQPRAAVDGNVLRVITRITGDFSDITLPATKRRVAEAVEQVMPLTMPGAFNQALMELGATVCLPNGAPECERCPGRDICFAYRENAIASLPVKAPKKARKVENRQVFLVFQGTSVLLHQRARKGLLAGLWEFPNCLEEESPPFEGLASFPFAGTGRHIFSHIEWHMTAFAGELSAPAPEGFVWATAEELKHRYSIPSAFGVFTELALQFLEERGYRYG